MIVQKPRVLLCEENIVTAAHLVKALEHGRYEVELLADVRKLRRAATVAREGGEAAVIVMEAGRTGAGYDEDPALDYHVERDATIRENPGRVVLLWSRQSRVERACSWGPLASVGPRTEVWLITKPFLMGELQEIVELIAGDAWDAGQHLWRKPVVWEAPVEV